MLDDPYAQYAHAPRIAQAFLPDRGYIVTTRQHRGVRYLCTMALRAVSYGLQDDDYGEGWNYDRSPLDDIPSSHGSAAFHATRQSTSRASPRRHPGRRTRASPMMPRAALPFTRACAKTAALALSSEIGDNALFLVDYALRVARLVVLLSIWRVILHGHGHEHVSGYTLASILTYTLVAEVFAEQFALRTSLDEALWQGTIATRLLQPLPLVAQIAADMVGRWLPGLIFMSIPLLCAGPLFGVHTLPAGLASGLWFLVSLSLSVSVGLALEFLFGGLVVILRQSTWVIARIRNALVTVLSGSLLPLAVLPWGLGDVFALLPFASMASAPLRIYTGTGDAAPLIGLQCLWSLVLWWAALALWRAGRERLVGYGG